MYKGSCQKQKVSKLANFSDPPPPLVRQSQKLPVGVPKPIITLLLMNTVGICHLQPCTYENVINVCYFMHWGYLIKRRHVLLTATYGPARTLIHVQHAFGRSQHLVAAAPSTLSPPTTNGGGARVRPARAEP